MRASEPVNRIMSTPVLSAGPDDPVQTLLQQMHDYPVHHVPVIEAGRVVGMVSKADIAKFQHFLPELRDPQAAALGWNVRRIMQTPVITIGEHDSARQAAETMVSNAIHCLPVVNAAGHLIGIVTTTDIMDACLHGTADPAAPAPHVDDTRALSAAQRAVGTGDDPHGIAGAFLHLQTRIAALERVLHEAKRYLNAGQDEQLHRALRLAIDQADRTGPPAV